jgi:hypothetical protein
MAVPFPDDVRQVVESTKWTFARTCAKTWPHEHMIRTPENAARLLTLARHVFAYGVEGHFYSDIRKYRCERGKVYWPMDPTPEANDLINRRGVAQTCEARPAAGTPPLVRSGPALQCGRRAAVQTSGHAIESPRRSFARRGKRLAPLRRR